MLASLDWLTVKTRIKFKFKILIMTYKVFNDQSPSYLKDPMVLNHPNRAVGSQTAGLFVVARVFKF